MCGIYKVTNKINGKSYIGQALNIQYRFARHKKDAFDPNKKQYYTVFYQALRKYGIDNFVFEVVEECTPDMLDEKEIYYIKKFETFGPKGYNLTSGGKTFVPVQVEDEILKEIIHQLKTTEAAYEEIANKYDMKPSTVHHINTGKCCYQKDEKYPLREPLGKLKQYCNQCPICGAKIYKQHKYCIRCFGQVLSEQKRTVERPDALSLAQLVVQNGFEQVGKMFGVSGNSIAKWCKQLKIPYKKQELVDWYNEQMHITSPPKQTKTRTPQSEITKPVQQIDPKTNKVIATYPSTKAAARNFDCPTGTNISRACKGKRKMAFGFIWRFV